jgi:Leucine-rich repeat (LRR) protein
MGALIMKPKRDSSSSVYSATPALPDGAQMAAVEGILNLEHRQVNNEAFAKISAVQTLTKHVLSLSLANNRITALVFDESVPGRPDLAAAASKLSEPSITAPVPVDDEDDERESSTLRSSCPKPLPSSAPMRSSNNWPILENLDLSGNNELFNYAGLGTVNATLRSLRLANNGIFKVPKEVWALANLTKLDLSHNRLLVLPPGIGLLTKLNSLKLSHNNLAANSNSSCIPEEMRFCSRLRRLDLSHNKLRELPVNWRVDRENATRRSLVRLPSLPPSSNVGAFIAAGSSSTGASSSPRLLASASSSSPRLPATSASSSSPRLPAAGNSSPRLPATSAPTSSPSMGSMQQKPTHRKHASISSSSPSTFSKGGSAVRKQTDTEAPPLSLAATAAPVPIKYFDPNRVSYIQITLLNLSNNQIDSLSPSIGLLRSLNSLNLGYNKLRSLPTEIALLAELKYLDLRFNQLPSLLTEICQLPRLSKLCLQNNKISALPYEIKKLKKLTHFFISSNQLVDLPDVISEIRNVRVLKLCNNKLLTIPDSMFRLQKLRLLDLRSVTARSQYFDCACMRPLMFIVCFAFCCCSLLFSFNKLTFLSPDVCSMPLIEDLRLWGNKLTDIPGPILYSDVKKIISYLKATERERCIIANQMRSLQGPRSHSRMTSLRSSPVVSRNRAQSATRAHSMYDRRFAPLGFYDDREGDREDGAPLMPASSRSTTGGIVPRSSIAGRRSAKSDSGSETEDMGSDDEFTAMFRAVTSRTGSFTNLADSRASSGGSSRRSTQAPRSPGPFAQPASSPREQAHTTIVQPFQSSFTLGISMVASNQGGSSGRGSSAALQAIRDGNDRDEEDECDADAEGEGDADQRPSDVLTDLVRRDWKPTGSPRAEHLLPPGMHLSRSASSPDPLPSQQPQPDKQLMEEWDVQSMAIEKQQTGKGTGRAKIGANY